MQHCAGGLEDLHDLRSGVTEGVVAEAENCDRPQCAGQPGRVGCLRTVMWHQKDVGAETGQLRLRHRLDIPGQQDGPAGRDDPKDDRAIVVRGVTPRRALHLEPE